MAIPNAENISRRAIILSGGKGDRMRAEIESWLGENRPKQYCTFVGTRSMLQHTVDRMAGVIDLDHIVIVIGPGHRVYLDQAKGNAFQGEILEQPSDRGSAAGIYLAATHLGLTDPQATVLICPSDHFIYPESQFHHYMNRACELAERYTDQLVLLGVVPSRPETDYGWIEMLDTQKYADWNHSDRRPMQVKQLHEKPDSSQARKLFHKGSLWNTMVGAVKLQTLLALGWKYLPKMMRRFDTYRHILMASRKGMVPKEHGSIPLNHTYRQIATADFTRDVLQQPGEWCSVLPIENIEWNDWGHPHRVWDTLGGHDADSVFSRRSLLHSDYSYLQNVCYISGENLDGTRTK